MLKKAEKVVTFKMAFRKGAELKINCILDFAPTPGMEFVFLTGNRTRMRARADNVAYHFDSRYFEVRLAFIERTVGEDPEPVGTDSLYQAMVSTGWNPVVEINHV